MAGYRLDFGRLYGDLVRTLLLCLILSGCAVHKPQVPFVDAIPYAQARLSGLRVIRERCIRCHSGDKPPNGLDLSNRDGIFKGGKRGPAVIPYKPHESPVWQAVTGNGITRMPPFAPLDEDEVEAIRIWIDHGAMTTSMGGQEP